MPLGVICVFMCWWFIGLQILKTKNFEKWALSEKVNDKSLIKAVKEIEQGLIDANVVD